MGLGGTKRWYSSNTGDWGARGISDVSQSAYNNYGDLRNLYNEGKAKDPSERTAAEKRLLRIMEED